MRKGVWWGLVGAGALALYAGNRVLLRYWDFGPAADELPQAVRDYRAAGLPWTAADLARHVPAEENAAPLLRRALAAMPGTTADIEFDKALKPDPAPYAPALVTLHEAAKRPKLDYERDRDLGPSLLFPEFAKIKQMAKVLVFRAERKAAAGDDAGALADLEDARRIGTLTGQETVLIAALVSVAVESIAYAGAERCIAKAYGDAPRLKRYAAWLARPAQPPDLRRAIWGESYGGVAAVRLFPSMGIGNSMLPIDDIFAVNRNEGEFRRSEDIPRDGIPKTVRAQAYMARHCQMWTELWRETNGLQGDVDEVNQRWAAIETRHYENDKGLSHQLDALLFPVFAQALKTPLNVLSRRAVMLGLAEAMIVRARTGRWPTSVSGRDPFDGKPLKVKLDRGRFRVYGVGKDGKDDGGLLGRERKVSDLGVDDVATYPPVPPKVPRTGALPPSPLVGR